jgi:hypothetical protein
MICCGAPAKPDGLHECQHKHTTVIAIGLLRCQNYMHWPVCSGPMCASNDVQPTQQIGHNVLCTTLSQTGKGKHNWTEVTIANSWTEVTIAHCTPTCWNKES